MAETIDRLFATGLYSDIQVDVEPQTAGVVVKFITKSAAFVGHVEVIGKVSTSAEPRRAGERRSDFGGTPSRRKRSKPRKTPFGSSLSATAFYDADVSLEKILIRIRTGRDHHPSQGGQASPLRDATILGHAKLDDATIRRATGWRIFLIHRWRNVSQNSHRDWH